MNKNEEIKRLKAKVASLERKNRRLERKYEPEDNNVGDLTEMAYELRDVIK